MKKTLITLAFASVFCASALADNTNSNNVSASNGAVNSSNSQSVDLRTDIAKADYTLGYSIGSHMYKDGINVDLNAFNAGMKDGLDAKKALLTEKDMQESMKKLQAEVQAKAKLAFDKESAKNLKDGDAFLQENKSKPGVIVTPSGLQYKVIVEGTGKKPLPNDVVTVDYKGSLINGTVFDSSMDNGRKPATFELGNNSLIKGWIEAIKLMNVGSKYEFVLPPKLAYGEHGVPGIGPNQTLIFTIHLISAEPNKANLNTQTAIANKSSK